MFTRPYTCLVTMLRVTPETRERVMRVAADDYQGASADETIRRLLEEHWQARAIAAARRFRAEQPDAEAEELADAGLWDAAAAPVVETDGPE